ncbi:hypothetical protein [Pseudomonas sp. MWU13-2517]|uniref:hypothetical protein n=1 Tax=Pseudomonas sp. MWU13-2517 TaxID=2929055 RepID=UPI00200E55B9|nr:hypothetical protein [Pseudomonas sp. MWU13-2517]
MNIIHASSLNDAFRLIASGAAAASGPGKASYQCTQEHADAVAKQDTMVRRYHHPLGQRLSDTPSADELAQAVRGAGLQVDIDKRLSDEELIASSTPEFIHPSKLTETPASLGLMMLEKRLLLQ